MNGDRTTRLEGMNAMTGTAVSSVSAGRRPRRPDAGPAYRRRHRAAEAPDPRPCGRHAVRVGAALGAQADRLGPPFRCAGRAVLIGSGDRASAATAGLVNGTSAHGYELDDTHEYSRSHPGAVVISAALAVGAEQGSSGRDVMAAIVAGYEVMTRLGMAAGALATTEVGFHATCLFGPFGAAAAAAKLMGLDAAALAQAWGIALSMTGGSSQFAFEPKGTMVKRMHGGIPAQNGIIAAQLASLGVAGSGPGVRGRAWLLSSLRTESRPGQADAAGGRAVPDPQDELQALFLLPQVPLADRRAGNRDRRLHRRPGVDRPHHRLFADRLASRSTR